MDILLIWFAITNFVFFDVLLIQQATKIHQIKRTVKRRLIC